MDTSRLTILECVESSDKREGQCGTQTTSEEPMEDCQLVITPISPLVHAAVAGCSGLVDA